MEKKERLKPISLYGYDLEEAIRAILSVDPRKLKIGKEKEEKQIKLVKAVKIEK